MKNSSFLLHIIFSITGFFLIQNVSLAVDPPPDTSLWRITADIWQRSNTCQSMLDGMESKFDTLSSKICVLDSKIVTESTFDTLSSAIDCVATESAFDTLSSKICVLDSKIVTESTFDTLSSAIDCVATESAFDTLSSKICVLDSKIATESAFDTLSSKICVLDSKIVTESTFDTLSSAIDYVATESAFDTLSSKICVLDSKIDFLDTRIDLCEPVAITNSTKITASGPYCLANDITDGPIIIDSDVVTLDLMGYKIINSDTGVLIKNCKSDILIKNGIIGGGIIPTETGISSICNNRVYLEDLNIIDCELVGLDLFATKTVKIKNCCIDNCVKGLRAKLVDGSKLNKCMFSYNDIGISLECSSKMVFNNCCAFSNRSSGFQLCNSTNNIFKGCKSIDNGQGGNGDAFGFISNNGMCNVFEECVTNGTRSNSIGGTNVVAGFALTNGERCSIISNCEISNNASNDVARSYGILLQHNGIGQTNFVQEIVANVLDSATINTIDWSPNGEFLAVGTSKGGIRIYEFDHVTKELSLIDSLTIADGTILSVNWSPNGEFLAVSKILSNYTTGESYVYVYEFDTNSKILTLRCSEQYLGVHLRSVHWSPDGNFLAVSGYPTFYVYEFDTNSKTLTLRNSQNHGAYSYSINWSPNGQFLAVAGHLSTIHDIDGFDISIYEFDIVTKELTLRNTQKHGANVNSVKWSPNGNFLAIGGYTGIDEFDIRIYEFDIVTKELTLRDSKKHGSWIIFEVDWSPDGKFLAICGYPSSNDKVEVRVYEFDAIHLCHCSLELTLMDSAEHGYALVSVKWSPDGKFLAVGGVKGDPDGTGPIPMSRLRVFEVNANFLVLENSKTYDDNVVLANWSPDGRFLAVGIDTDTNNTEMRVYKFDTSNQALILNDSETTTGSTKSATWSPDGQFLAVGIDTDINNSEIRVYKFDTSNQTLILKYSETIIGSIRSVDWSLDKFLAVGINTDINNSEIRVYKFDTSNQTLILKYSETTTGSTKSVDWSSDSQFLASGVDIDANNTEIRIYKFDTSNQILILKHSEATAGSIRSVDWSPVDWSSDKFLSVGINTDINNSEIRVYKFDTSNQVLILNDSETTTGSTKSATWSPDGQFLAVGIDTDTNNTEIRVYKFDTSNQALILKNLEATTGSIQSVDWSPDGQFLLAGVIENLNVSNIFIYRAFRFPNKNIIRNNVVNNVGDDLYYNACISGPSSCNFIVSNITYSKKRNYEFVTNLFSGNLNGVLTLNNISFP